MNAEPKDPKPSGKARVEYVKVVKSAELKAIVLLSSSFDVDRDSLEGLESDADGEINLAFSYGAEVPEVGYDTEQGEFSGRFDWYVKAEQNERAVIDIRGSYGVVYGCETELDREAVHNFVLRVGKFATFPYFRQLVAFYGSSSGLNLPVLPVLKEWAAPG